MDNKKEDIKINKILKQTLLYEITLSPVHLRFIHYEFVMLCDF
jgi:hypothetical protein